MVESFYVYHIWKFHFSKHFVNCLRVKWKYCATTLNNLIFLDEILFISSTTNLIFLFLAKPSPPRPNLLLSSSLIISIFQETRKETFIWLLRLMAHVLEKRKKETVILYYFSPLSSCHRFFGIRSKLHHRHILSYKIFIYDSNWEKHFFTQKKNNTHNLSMKNIFLLLRSFFFFWFLQFIPNFRCQWCCCFLIVNTQHCSIKFCVCFSFFFPSVALCSWKWIKWTLKQHNFSFSILFTFYLSRKSIGAFFLCSRLIEDPVTTPKFQALYIEIFYIVWSRDIFLYFIFILSFLLTLSFFSHFEIHFFAQPTSNISLLYIIHILYYLEFSK